MSDFMRIFDRIDVLFEYGNFRVADEVLYGLLGLFNKACEEKGLYRDREGKTLTMQMRYVKNFHDLRDILKLELDVVNFEESYEKLTKEQKKKVLDFTVNRLLECSNKMKTVSTVSSDDGEMDDVSVEESGISISYRIIHAGTDKEEYVVEGYSFPAFERKDFHQVAKEAKKMAADMADQNEVYKATRGAY